MFELTDDDTRIRELLFGETRVAHSETDVGVYPCYHPLRCPERRIIT